MAARIIVAGRATFRMEKVAHIRGIGRGEVACKFARTARIARGTSVQQVQVLFSNVSA